MDNQVKINSILIIEDDELTASIYNIVLSEIDIFTDILIKTDPEEGLEYIKETALQNRCPEIICIDIKMQGLTGFELIEEINNLKIDHCIKSKIIVLTSSSFIKDLEKAKELGVDDYLLKPLTKEKIGALVDKHFR